MSTDFLFFVNSTSLTDFLRDGKTDFSHFAASIFSDSIFKYDQEICKTPSKILMVTNDSLGDAVELRQSLEDLNSVFVLTM